MNEFVESAIPAYALYHDTNAVIIPNAPPARWHPTCGFCPSFRRYATPNSKNVMSSIKNNRKNPTVDFSVQSRSRNVNINHPIRNSPILLFKPAPPSDSFSDASIPNPPGVSRIANEIQKPPYDDNAVAPNVLPMPISHIPASSCTRPP